MQKRAYLLIAAGAVLWGTIGIFVRGFYGFGFSPLQVVTLRVFSAAVIMLIYLLFTRPELLKIRVRDSLYFVGTGIFSLAFFNLCYFTTIRETSIAIAVTLLYTAPAFVAVLSRVFFRESLGVKKTFFSGANPCGMRFCDRLSPGTRGFSFHFPVRASHRIRGRFRICPLQHIRKSCPQKVPYNDNCSLYFHFCKPCPPAF